MPSVFQDAFNSKKFLAFVATMIVVIGNKVVGHWGFELDQTTVELIVGSAATYILAQGVADHGKSAALIRANTPVEIHSLVAVPSVPSDAPSTVRTPQAGMARLSAMLAMIVVVPIFYLMTACGGGMTSNEKALMVTTATFSAGEAAFVAWDGKHQLDIVAACSVADGKAACDKKLADYRAARDKVVLEIVTGGRAIDAAWIAIDDKTVATAIAAGVAIEQALAALGVK